MIFILLLTSSFTLLYTSLVLIPSACSAPKNLCISFWSGSTVFIHLLPFPFNHLYPFKNNFSTLRYAITCTCITTCLYNHLVDIFQDLATLLIYFQIIYKQAMSPYPLGILSILGGVYILGLQTSRNQQVSSCLLEENHT